MFGIYGSDDLYVVDIIADGSMTQGEQLHWILFAGLLNPGS